MKLLTALFALFMSVSLIAFPALANDCDGGACEPPTDTGRGDPVDQDPIDQDPVDPEPEPEPDPVDNGRDRDNQGRELDGRTGLPVE